MDKLEDLIGGGGGGTSDSRLDETAPEREIYKEEQDKIDAWKDEVEDQVFSTKIFTIS